MSESDADFNILRELELRHESDVLTLREQARQCAAAMGLALARQTEWLTAASELGLNAVRHAGGGHAAIGRLRSGGRVGIRLIVTDHGAGIADLERAMQAGSGLAGARRLSDEFDVASEPGHGSRVTITKWASPTS